MGKTILKIIWIPPEAFCCKGSLNVEIDKVMKGETLPPYEKNKKLTVKLQTKFHQTAQK
jgi:hypothetical protein